MNEKSLLLFSAEFIENISKWKYSFVFDELFYIYHLCGISTAGIF
jgi:hypothetical protein